MPREKPLILVKACPEPKTEYGLHRAPLRRRNNEDRGDAQDFPRPRFVFSMKRNGSKNGSGS